MDIDKISESRLFENNSKEEISRWCKSLRYFHYMRDRGGHNCEGDSFCVYFKYSDREDLTSKMEKLGVELKKLKDGFIPFDPSQSYSFDDLDKLTITIGHFSDLEQPQHADVFGYKVHIWVLPARFEISVSGTNSNHIYKVSDEDFKVCLALEDEFDKLGWRSIVDEDIKKQRHCISEDRYPELFSN